MSLFGKILSGLGINKADASSTSTQADNPANATLSTSATPNAGSDASLDALLKQAADANRNEPTPAVLPTSQVTVDVSAKLDELTKKSGQTLNWRSSIVDLLKVLNLDSSLEARKSLAQELNCPAEKLTDSAQMNIWLHKQVMQKLAENGGEVPADLR